MTPLSSASSGAFLLIGAGRFARSLARTFPDRIAGVVAAGEGGERIAEILSRDRIVPSHHAPLPPFDHLWILTPDRAIGSVASELAATRERWDGMVVIHSSGATPLTVLDPFREKGASTIALHPNLSLTGEEPVPRGAYWSFTTADEKGNGEALARAILDGLEPRPVAIADEDRSLYHAAASAAANYSVALFAMASKLYERAGIAPEDAREIVASFMRSSVERAATTGAENVITGPIVRGDLGVVRAQIEAIEHGAPELLDAFRAMGSLTARLFTDEGKEEWKQLFE